jgi:putative DNA primase/helicase
MTDTHSIASDVARDHANPARIELLPNKDHIATHVYALFSPRFVQPYPDAWIEIAWSDPESGDLNRARKFSAHDLEPIVDFAERKNREGYNVYVGAALRQGDMPVKGRANDDNFQVAAFVWADFDGVGDGERIDVILKENELTPALIVTTGSVPHLRAHLYFAINDGIDRAKVVAALTSLKILLKSDNVDNASRLLRLAGTVNYPTANKLERGYVPELVTLRQQVAHTYQTDHLIGLAPTTRPTDPFTTHGNGVGGGRGRNDDELLAMLKASRVDGHWRDNMLLVVATLVGRGESDSKIRLICASYCNDGANDPDLTKLIADARIKFDKPNGDIDGDIVTKEGDERMANQAPVAAELPTIRINPRISMVTTRTQKTLIEAGVPFYQRGGELVRPVIRAVKAAHGRLTKTAQLKPVTATYMRDTMCRHILWERFAHGDWTRAMAPMNVATTLLDRDGVWGFQEIVGVIATPTMRPDGSLLVKQGYDLATRLLLIEPPAMPEIPDQPTRYDAMKALALLEELIAESPFDDEASRSVALSGLITPVVRGAFAVAPMHVSSAPVAGSGKSFLWDLVAGISTGQQRMPVIAAGNEEETAKRLTGVMLTGQPLISIDNVNGELKGDFLCQAIEQHFLDIRPLGRSDIVRIQTGGVTIFATGNNIIIVGDLCRRTITARLDAKLENPQMRQFRNDPIRRILDDRGTYIAACLTICRAYIVAGRPGLLPRLASFEGWSDTVRSALVWLGKADAINSMEDTRAEDPQRAALTDLLNAWSQDHGVGAGSNVSLAVIIEKSMKIDRVGGIDSGEFKYPELNAAVRAAVLAIAVNAPGSKVDPVRFGQYCKANKGRIIEGLFLANKPSSRGGAATWWVDQAKAA